MRGYINYKRVSQGSAGISKKNISHLVCFMAGLWGQNPREQNACRALIKWQPAMITPLSH